jgi:hypothetical protein
VKATISGIEQAFTTKGSEYLKVKVIDENGKETTKTVFDNLKEKWELLTEGACIDFKMEKRGQFWNVVDLTAIDGENPPEIHPAGTAIVPEEMKTFAGQLKDISGAETGRCWNDIRELFISGKMISLFGKENAESIAKQYRGYLLSTLKLNYDGKLLPTWEKKGDS